MSPPGGESPTIEADAAPPEGGEGNFAAVARGSSLLFIARIVGNAGYFVAVLILARALSIPHRGQFAFVTTAAQITSRLAGLGVGEATTIFVAQERELRGRLLTNLLLFSLASSIVAAVAIAGGIAALGGDRPAGLTDMELVLLAIGAVVSSLYGVGTAFLIGCGQWRTQALTSAIVPWFYAVALLLMWVGPRLGVDGALIVWIGIYIVWGVILLAACVREAPFARPAKDVLKRSMRFGLRAWIGSVTLLLNYRTDQIVMGFIGSQVALGVYVVSVNASELLLILPSAAGTAIIPVLARSAAGSRGDRTLRTFRLVTVISLGAMIVAATCGSLLLPIVFGARYHASIVPFLWLITGTLGFVAYNVFGSALVAASAPGLASVAQLVSFALGFALDLALIPPLGATGAAIATSVAATAAGAIACIAYRRRVRFEYREVLPGRGDVVAFRSVVAYSFAAIQKTLRLTNRSSPA